MKATFRVASIEYVDGQTNVELCLGNVGSGDIGMGVSATLQLSGIEAIDTRLPRPGTVVMVTIEAAPPTKNPNPTGRLP